MTRSFVAIHPDKAELLVRALARTGVELDSHARGALALLGAHGAPFDAAVRLAEVADDFATEAAQLHRLVVTVRAWEAAAALPNPVLSSLRGPLHRAHADPGPSLRAAREVALRVSEGDAGALVEAAEKWGSDPVFAAALLEFLGAEGVLDSVSAAVGAPRWGEAPPGPEAARLGALAGWLALDSRSHPPAIAAGDLVDAAEARSLDLAALGALVVGVEGWDPAWLAELADRVLAPVNRAILAAEPLGPHGLGSTPATDGRILLLEALAASPAAARLFVLRHPLPVLLEADVGWPDRGDALVAALVAGTRPPVLAGAHPADLAAAHPAAYPASHREAWALAAGRLMEAVAGAGRLAPRVEDGLGTIAGPWLAELGSGELDSIHPRAVIGDLSPEARARFLERAVASERSAGFLWAATWSWAHFTLARPGPAPDAPTVRRVSDVVAALRDAEDRVMADAALVADERGDRDVAMWSTALSVVTGTLPGVVGTTLSGASGMVTEAGVPDRTEVADRLLSLPAELAGDQRVLQWVVLAALWDARGANGLFAPGAGSSTQAATLEGTGLLDAEGRLRDLLALDPYQRARWEAWLVEEARRDSPVARLLAAAAEEMGASAAGAAGR